MKRILWQGRFLRAIDEDGWEYVERRTSPEVVVIVAVQDERVLLVEQDRRAAGGRVLELPAGLVGDEDADEDLATAAARELEEETGWRAGALEVLGSYFSSPGLTPERYTVVRATRLTRVADGGGVGGEDIAVHRVRLSELADFVRRRRAEGVGVDVKLWLVLGPDAI